MLHDTTMRGPGSQRDRARTRRRRIAIAIRKCGSDGAVGDRIQNNARRRLDVKRVVMLRGMGLHGRQDFDCGTFKDEGRGGPIARQESIDAVHHHRHQIDARRGDFYIEEKRSDVSPSNYPVEQLFKMRHAITMLLVTVLLAIAEVRTKLCERQFTDRLAELASIRWTGTIADDRFKPRGAQECLVLIRVPIMPEHDLPILGETEVALKSIGSILLHGALKRRHGVLDCETGGATMANHQKWRGRVRSCSPPGIATYHLKEPL